MNRWNIPDWLEKLVKSRDKRCVYCGKDFEIPPQKRGDAPSWEHIINDATIINLDNIAICCVSCNASKGSKDLRFWMNSKYCKRNKITSDSVALVIQQALGERGYQLEVQ